MNKKPNIVFILSDDQGAYSLGCLNNSELKTPALDNLAQEGIRFDHCFCASPVCSPARASILTGSIPSRHGVHDWIRAGNIEPKAHNLSFGEKVHYDYIIEHKPIDYLEGLPTYTDILQKNGYTCALAGKWHLGNSIKPQCGFTKWYTIGKGGCNNYMDPDVVENKKISFPKKYITDLITDKAIEFIDDLSHKPEPFYLSIHYTAPHSPWDAKSHKKEYLDLYKDCDYEKYYPNLPNHTWSTNGSKSYNTPEKRAWAFRGYEASITAMDEGIGRVIDELKKQGVYENTIIIFTSDNGFNMGHHGLFGKGNATNPTNVYEESITVPFIASWKGHFPDGVVQDSCISHYDLFPTILDLAGIDYSLDSKQPGTSFKPLLEGKEKNDADNDVFIYDEYGSTRMVRTQQYKYVHRFPDGPHELYDLTNDPHEQNNLYSDKKYTSIVKSLRNRLFDWFNTYMSDDKDGTIEPANGLGQLRCYDKNEKFDIFYQPDYDNPLTLLRKKVKWIFNERRHKG